MRPRRCHIAALSSVDEIRINTYAFSRFSEPQQADHANAARSSRGSNCFAALRTTAMSTSQDQSEIIRFLSRPEIYPGAASVDTITTHASMIFLAGERAYKLKRAVKYSYLD